jgi:2-dehydro-3-deoxygluconokinase
MVADDLDWDFIAAAEWLQLSGILPAISEVCKQSTVEIAARARKLGLRVFFDVNYRSLLWTEDQARATCEAILPFANLVTATEAEVAILLDAELVDRDDALERLLSRYDLDAIVMTLGAEGSIAYDGMTFYSSAGYKVEAINRLGAGDAFDAGLLYGYANLGLQAGLEYGSAMAALKMTIPQNIPIISKGDVERLIIGRDIEIVR